MKKIIAAGLLIFLVVNAGVFGSMEETEPIKDGEELRMTLIAAFANEAYWGSMANGFTKAGEDLGLSTKCIGFTEIDVEKQIEAIKSAIYAKVDGIVTAETKECEEFNQVLEEAKEAGIPVVLVDSNVEEAEKLCYIGTNNYEAGALAGRDIVEVTEGKGNVAVILSSLESENQRDRLKGFQDVLDDYPEMKIVKVLEGNSDSRILNEHLSRLLEEEKGLTAVFCAEGYSATSMGQIIKDAKGEYDDLKVVGFGVSAVKKDDIEKGVLYSTIYQNSYEMGYRALEALKKSIGHETVKPVDYTEIKSIKKENIEEMDINEGKGAQWHIY